MGKRNYAERLYGEFSRDEICDCDSGIDFFGKKLLLNLHLGIRNLMLNGINAHEFFADNISSLRDCVIIGDEISSGVIPIEKFERDWRDETGKIYQFLSSEADIVDRVWAGLAIRLKG